MPASAQALLAVLNSQSPEPLYKQLAAELAARIASGQYRAGDQIPSEPELARTYSLGRPTVRQATDLLIQRGQLERRRGAGTFVKATEPHVSLFDWGGTTAAFEKSGLALETVLLQRPTACVVDEPGHVLNGRAAHQLVRLARLDHAPVLLERMLFDAEVFPDLNRLPLRGKSISNLVQQIYHRAPTSVRQSFSVGKVERRWLDAMQVKPTTRVLVVHRILDFAGALAACTSVMYCRTDQVQFTQTLPMQAM